MRTFLAVLAGFVSGSLVVTVSEWLSHRLYPLPPLDFNDPVALRAAIATLPLAALILVVAGWTIGTFVGASAGVAVARPPRKTLVAWLVGLTFLAATALNLAMIPHPMWMTVAGPAGVVAAAWLASRQASTRT